MELFKSAEIIISNDNFCKQTNSNNHNERDMCMIDRAQTFRNEKTSEVNVDCRLNEGRNC